MGFLLTLVLVLQLVSALGVIVLVLLQHGKGADMGAAFGSGASGSLFGATGSANFLSRMTAAFATVFFLSTLAISLLHTKVAPAPTSVMDQGVPAKAPANPASGIPGAAGTPATPAAPAAAPATKGSEAAPPAKGAPASDIPK